MYTSDEAFAYTQAIVRSDPAGCLRVFYPDHIIDDDRELDAAIDTARRAGVPYGCLKNHRIFVDVGSGTGQQAFILKQLDPMSDVYAINLFATQSALRDHHGVHTVFGDATKAEVWATIPKKVDGIILSYVIGHVELNTDYSLFLADRLKRTGRIVIQGITPRHVGVGRTIPIFGEYRLYTMAEICEWMAYSGLEIDYLNIYESHKRSSLTAGIREVTTKEQQKQILRDVCGFDAVFKFPETDEDKTEEPKNGEVNAPVA